MNRRKLAFVVAGALACGPVLGACEDGTPPPKTPGGPGAGVGPAVMPTAPSPAGPQVAVADPGIPGAAEMDPQAKALYQQGLQAFSQGQHSPSSAQFG